MYTVYVLRSQKTGKRYVGFTQRTVEIRLKEHNQGLSTWTRGHRPFVIVHQEVYTDGTAARKRERFLKSGQGRKFLDSLTT